MRLIDGSELLKKLRKAQKECEKQGEEFGGEDILFAEAYDCACDMVKEMPTIKLDSPEKVGRWIVHHEGGNNWCECSECNTVGSPFWKRCPVCEAKMLVKGD